MGNTNPLESLAAFVICFVAGALTTAGLGTYIGKLKRDVRKSSGASPIRSCRLPGGWRRNLYVTSGECDKMIHNTSVD